MDIGQLAKNKFGIEELLPAQEKAIERVLKKQHTLLLMPTGQGKSICFQLPALILPGLTLVVSPLIALMNDQVAALKEQGLAAEFINSSLSGREREDRYKQLANHEYKLLYVSPERFYKDEFLAAIANTEVSLLAIDEAHCISQWGSDFRPAYSQLGDFRKRIGNVPALALTATATPQVQTDIIKGLGVEGDAEIIHTGISRHNLALKVGHSFAELEKFAQVYQLVKEQKGAVIVYFNLVKNLEAFSAYLDQQRLTYICYHGKLDTGRRNQALKKFQRAENILVLATNAFGMGINKPNVRMIIHAEIPGSLESYYQEVGRAGRDGLPATCILFYDQADLAVQMDFLKFQNPQRQFIEGAYRVMVKMQERGQTLDYDELQEALHYKNRHDHRLQTVLNLFDRFEITQGDITRHTLKMIGGPGHDLLQEEALQKKAHADQQRLVKMVEYANAESCRMQLIESYFGFESDTCGLCDNCQRD